MNLGPLLAVLYALGWGSMFVFRAESVWLALPHYARAEALSVAVTPLLLSLHMTSACLLLNVYSVPLSGAVAAGGVFLMAVIFWFWARAQIGEMRRPRLPHEPPLRLRRDGPFGLVRHPLYFSYLVASAAPLLALPRWPLLASYTACLAAIIVRAVQEERRMHAQLGAAYAEYCDKVKRLVPWIW